MTKFRIGFALLIYVVCGFSLYSKSLPYSFVYDDHIKVQHNPALKGVSTAISSFWDRNAQSTNPGLNTHTYRPFLTFLFYIQKQLWGDNPSGYRIVNILLHAFNATLVFVLGTTIFGFSITTSGLAGLLFLFHPAQVESVVWVVEFSNILSLSFILSSLILWHRYREQNKKTLFWGSICAAALGLLTRETAAIVPFVLLLLLLNSRFLEQRSDLAISGVKALKIYWKEISFHFSVVFLFIIARSLVLGSMAQISFQNNLFWSRLGLVAESWKSACAFLVVPAPSTINHGAVWLFNPSLSDIFYSVSILSVSFLLALIGLTKKNVSGILLALMFVFWLPTSQIFPLAKIFSERFLYPILAPASLLLASSFFRTYKPLRLGGLCLVIGLWIFLSWRAIPAWENNVTLWSQAVQVNPKDGVNWYNLAEAEKIEARNKRNEQANVNDFNWIFRCEAYYIKALKLRLPNELAGVVFINLAEINLMLGRQTSAQEYARRGLLLQPGLEDLWNHHLTRFGINSRRKNLSGRPLLPH